VQELTATQALHNSSYAREAVTILEIIFTNGFNVEGKNDFYFSTHDYDALAQAGTIAMPARERWFPVLDVAQLSNISQSMDELTGITALSSLTIKIPDIDTTLSQVIKAADEAGFGLNRQLVDLYYCEAGDIRDEWVQVARQQIESASLNKGWWTIGCVDVMRAARKDIMTPDGALLSADITASATSFDLARFKDGAFPFAASKSYVIINDEAIKINTAPTLNGTGTLLTFSSVVRGQMGTVAAAHLAGDDVTDAKRYIGNPIDIALSLLTGSSVAADAGYWADGLVDRYSVSWSSGATGIVDRPTGSIPPMYSGATVTFVGTYTVSQYTAYPSSSYALAASWHAGMSYEHHIDAPEWLAIQEQIATTNLGAGDLQHAYDLWFDKSVNAKNFVETKILQPMGLRMYAKPNGKLGLIAYKALTDNPVPDQASQADYHNAVLDMDTVKSYGAYHVLKKGTLMSKGTLYYGKSPRVGKGDYTRTPTFFDVAAQEKHGDGKHFKLYAPGLISADGDSVEAHFVRTARVVQRYASPPKYLQVSALPMMGAYGIGDSLRVRGLPIHDPYAGAELNACFVVLNATVNPKNLSVDFDLIRQDELAYPIPDFRFKSPYTPSAWLNGLNPNTIPAAQDLLLLSPTGSALDLAEGDYYIPQASNAVYTMSGTWTLNGTVRIFYTGTLEVATGAKLDGKGRGNTYNGYASQGEAGTNGRCWVDWKEGYFKWSKGYWTHRDSIINGDASIVAGKYQAGTANVNAFALDIVAKTKDGAGTITSITGLPNVSLCGAQGGGGGDAVDSQKQGKLYHAAGWAVGAGYAGQSNHLQFVYPITAAMRSGAAGAGGAGLLICGPKFINSGLIDLSGGDSDAQKAVISHGQDSGHDYDTYHFQSGKSGNGGAGACVIISDVDPLHGAHLANGTLLAPHKEFLI